MEVDNKILPDINHGDLKTGNSTDQGPAQDVRRFARKTFLSGRFETKAR